MSYRRYHSIHPVCLCRYLLWNELIPLGWNRWSFLYTHVSDWYILSFGQHFFYPSNVSVLGTLCKRALDWSKNKRRARACGLYICKRKPDTWWDSRDFLRTDQSQVIDRQTDIVKKSGNTTEHTTTVFFIAQLFLSLMDRHGWRLLSSNRVT